MPITSAQREARKSHLGSSDIATLLGLNPWANARDLFLDKTGALTEWDGNEATHLGDLLEPVVLKLASEQLGSLIVPETRVVASCPIIACNTDAIVEVSGEPVEAKTSSIQGPGGSAKDEWGEEGTDEVPLRVIVQATCHMLAWEKDICHVPALIGHRGFVLYQVPRNENVATMICEKATEFWEKNVLANVPPDIAPHIEIAKRMRRQAEKVTEVPTELVAAWLKAVEQRKEAEKTEDTVKAALLAEMGDAEAAVAGACGAVTFFQQTRKEYVCKESTFRVLRHKKNGL